jgi:hypothetical protein
VGGGVAGRSGGGEEKVKVEAERIESGGRRLKPVACCVRLILA